MRPYISIIVPCYNQAQYLSECLQSVLEQDYKDWECLIINDGSPDNTKQIAQEWCLKDPRFKYIEKANGGICETRNFGIQHAEGNFILPLDADDKIASGYIKEAIHILIDKPDVKLVYCNTVFFGLKNSSAQDTEYSFEKLLYENIIHHAGIFRKSDFKKTDGYNLNMHDGLEDWDFWLALINPKDKVVKIEGYYYYYRIKKISRSTLIDQEINNRLLLQIFCNHMETYLNYSNPIKDHKDAIYYKWALQWVRGGKEYKLGAFIFWPYNYIKRVLWRRKLKQDKL